MDWSFNYVVSQVLVILGSILFAGSYTIKKRTLMTAVVASASICYAFSYVFLHAWTGAVMSLVSVTRGLLFAFDRDSGKDYITLKEWSYFILISIASVIVGVLTYAGWYCIFPPIATIIYTFGLCQKNSSVYKILEVPSGTCMVLYTIFVHSIFGIISESAFILVALIMFIKEKIDKSKETLVKE